MKFPGSFGRPSPNLNHNPQPSYSYPKTPGDDSSSIASWANTSDQNKNNGDHSIRSSAAASNPFRDPSAAPTPISDALTDGSRAPVWDALTEDNVNSSNNGYYVPGSFSDNDNNGGGGGGAASPPYHPPTEHGFNDDGSPAPPHGGRYIHGEDTPHSPRSDDDDGDTTPRAHWYGGRAQSPDSYRNTDPRAARYAATASPLFSNAHGRIQSVHPGDSLYDADGDGDVPMHGGWKSPPSHWNGGGAQSASTSYRGITTPRAAPRNGGTGSVLSSNAHGRFQSLHPGDSLYEAEIDASLYAGDSLYGTEVDAEGYTKMEPVWNQRRTSYIPDWAQPKKAKSQDGVPTDLRRSRHDVESQDSFRTARTRLDSDSQDNPHAARTERGSTATPRGVLGYTPDPYADQGIPKYARKDQHGTQDWDAKTLLEKESLKYLGTNRRSSSNDNQDGDSHRPRENPSLGQGVSTHHPRSRRPSPRRQSQPPHNAESRSRRPPPRHRSRVRSSHRHGGRQSARSRSPQEQHYSYSRERRSDRSHRYRSDRYRPDSRRRYPSPGDHGNRQQQTPADPSEIRSGVTMGSMRHILPGGGELRFDNIPYERTNIENIVRDIAAMSTESQPGERQSTGGADKGPSHNGGPTVFFAPTINTEAKMKDAEEKLGNISNFMEELLNGMKNIDKSQFSQQIQGQASESKIDLALNQILAMAEEISKNIDDLEYPETLLRHEVDGMYLAINEFRESHDNHTQVITRIERLSQLGNRMKTFETKASIGTRGGIATTVLLLLCSFLMGTAKATGVYFDITHSFDRWVNCLVSDICLRRY
ncbi:MAG: hypothetical protein M1831_001562 [Alyxoria varia]|nr:MAG: hypothetical protein M1831_001562 [Alyxoria varia]